MSIWLKQSTAKTVSMGPFLDDTDGKTPETLLTIAQADIRLSKNGGTYAQSNNAAGGTHQENGYYSIPLDTTDTGTVGNLRVAILKTGALPIWQDFQIVPAVIYDSLVGGTDYLVVEVSVGTGPGQINLSSGRVGINWADILNPTTTVDLSGTTTKAVTDVDAILSNATYGNAAIKTQLDDVHTDVAAVQASINNAATVADIASAILITPANKIANGTSGVVDCNTTQWRGAQPNVLASGRLDVSIGETQTDAISAAGLAAAAVNKVSDGLLDRNMGTGTDSGSPTVRTVRQALRFLRNKWAISAGTLTVYKEDDATASFTASVTTSAVNPVTALDPAGP